MKKGSKLSYKQIIAAQQRQKQLQITLRKQAKSSSLLFRFCFKLTKFLIIFLIAFGVLMSLLISLDPTVSLQNQNAYQKYSKEQQKLKHKKNLQNLLKKQGEDKNSNLINLHLQSNVNQQERENNLKDLNMIAVSSLKQLDPDSQIAVRSLKVKCVQWGGIVSEPITSKILFFFRQSLKKLMNYLNLKESSSKNKVAQNQNKISILKQLIMKKKFGKIKDFLINELWTFINKKQNYILYWNFNIKEIENKKTILKSFKKWIKQHDDSIIFVVSQSPLNEQLNDSEKFKSYEVTSNLNQIQQKLLKSQLFLQQEQIQLLKQKLSTFAQLSNFLKFAQDKRSIFNTSLNTQQKQEIDGICQQNNRKFYFYNEQQNAYQIMQKSKIQSPQRLQRQLQALKIKLSILKDKVGINYFIDLYKTFNSDSKVKLSALNQVGVNYHFQDNSLSWKQEFYQLLYEFQTNKRCRISKDQIKQKQEEQKQLTKDQSTQNLLEQKQDVTISQNIMKQDQTFQNKEQVSDNKQINQQQQQSVQMRNDQIQQQIQVENIQDSEKGQILQQKKTEVTSEIENAKDQIYQSGSSILTQNQQKSIELEQNKNSNLQTSTKKQVQIQTSQNQRDQNIENIENIQVNQEKNLQTDKNFDNVIPPQNQTDQIINQINDSKNQGEIQNNGQIQNQAANVQENQKKEENA